MRVFIGFDRREQAAYEVAEHSLRRRATVPLEVTALRAERLAAAGLLTRPVDARGSFYDIISNAPAATEFANSRFMVPLLAQSGWALFVDSDVVFLDDVANLFKLADPQYAVMVVKHQFVPKATVKMDGQVQTAYSRKCWSSVMLLNADHSANRRLSLHDVNHRRGLELHNFYWLHDSEIGELPAHWNWLVGEQPMPIWGPSIAHFTNGTPDMPGHERDEYASIWTDELEHLRASKT